MTCVPIIVWNLNSNETWFLARIFPKVRIDWVLRLSAQMCPHNLASMSLKLAGGWPLGKVAHLVNYYCPKSPQISKNNARNHSYSVILYWSTYIGKFQGHLVYSGEISEQHSLIREADRDQPTWQIYVSVHKGWPACGIWLRRNPDCWPEGHLQLETWTILIIKRSLQLNFMHISCVTDICLMKISIDSR